MLFLKSYIRTLFRHRAFTFINLFGLSFALAFVILIGSWLLLEINVNRNIQDVERIYMVMDSGGNNAGIDYRVKQMLVDGLPGIETGGLYYRVNLHLNYKDKVFTEDKIVSVDNDFLKLMGVKLKRGNQEKPLQGRDEALICESLAKKMFGDEDPIGKTVIFNHNFPLFIVGITEDLPENSSIKGNFFVNAENPAMHFSMWCRELHDGENPEDKCSMIFYVFIKLEEGVDPQFISNKSREVIPDDIRFPSKISLFPFSKYYLHDSFLFQGLDKGNPRLIKILCGVALIILLLAVINYINLTTAGYKLRLRETGVKKASGAKRKRLIGEFIIESVIICGLAGYLATLLAQVLLPVFNNYLDTKLTIQVFSDFNHFLLFISFILVLGVLAGLYPAVYLSSINPQAVFSSGIYTERGGKTVRNILNWFQFTIAISLISVIIVMQKQIAFVRQEHLGFRSEHLMRLNLAMQPEENVHRLIQKIRMLPGVTSISATAGVPGEINNWMGGHAAIGIDSTFYETFGIEVIEGRKLMGGDVDKCCLINETAWKRMDEKTFEGKIVNSAEVLGVVNDFHITSLHKSIEPTALFMYSWFKPNNISLRVQDADLPGFVEKLKKCWKEVCPEYPFQYNFYDEWFDSMYKKEEGQGRLISIFALLAITICCMGIFGLVLFTTEQRSKEIGIRKVHGATTGEIMARLAIEFTKIIAVAFLIAVPISWYAIDQWLAGFAYHTRLSGWIFAISGLISLMVAFITISFQCWKAATGNPVDALRYE